MKKILFVNEDTNVLDGLRRMLLCYRTEWSMEFFQSNREALVRMAEVSFDVLVTDIHGSDTDGVSLLAAARRRFPKTVRIALSSQTEQDALLQAFGSAHQFVSIPCEAETIKVMIARACAVRAHLNNSSVGDLVGYVSALPALPTLYKQLVQELKSPDASVDRVGEIIAQDVGMTTKILQLVNSSFFGLQSRVTDPGHAATLLGLRMILPLVLGVGIFEQFDQAILKRLSLDTLMDHSLEVATGAQRIASQYCDDDQLIADCMLVGILHDVGKLVLASNITDSYREALELAARNEIPLFQAEMHVLGANHADVGGHLLDLWGFPNSVVEAVAFHHAPANSAATDFTLLTAIHIADVMAHCSGAGKLRSGAAALDEAYLARLKIEERLDLARIFQPYGPEPICAD